jgi:hypothetical protein
VDSVTPVTTVSLALETIPRVGPDPASETRSAARCVVRVGRQEHLAQEEAAELSCRDALTADPARGLDPATGVEDGITHEMTSSSSISKDASIALARTRASA